MKKNIYFGAVLLASVVPAVSANAADVRNIDAKPYTLIVKNGAETFKTVIDPQGFIRNLCSDCTVEVEGYSISDIGNVQTLQLTNGVLVEAD